MYRRKTNRKASSKIHPKTTSQDISISLGCTGEQKTIKRFGGVNKKMKWERGAAAEEKEGREEGQRKRHQQQQQKQQQDPSKDNKPRHFRLSWVYGETARQEKSSRAP